MCSNEAIYYVGADLDCNSVRILTTFPETKIKGNIERPRKPVFIHKYAEDEFIFVLLCGLRRVLYFILMVCLIILCKLSTVAHSVQ